MGQIVPFWREARTQKVETAVAVQVGDFEPGGIGKGQGGPPLPCTPHWRLSCCCAIWLCHEVGLQRNFLSKGWGRHSGACCENTGQPWGTRRGFRRTRLPSSLGWEVFCHRVGKGREGSHSERYPEVQRKCRCSEPSESGDNEKQVRDKSWPREGQLPQALGMKARGFCAALSMPMLSRWELCLKQKIKISR